MSMCIFYPGVLGFFSGQGGSVIFYVFIVLPPFIELLLMRLSHVRFKIIPEGRWGMPCHPILHI